MFRIYEIRNKATHQIVYLNLFADRETPDEEFRKNPDSEYFKGKKDIYIAVREESYEDKDSAWEACMKLFVQYKLMPKAKLEENIKTPKRAKPKRSPKK